jgi:glycine dehydrogenase subunit 1
MSHRYFPHTQGDIKEMLQACGVDNLDDLYSDVSNDLRLARAYDLPSSLSEPEVVEWFKAIGKQNCQLTCFAGCGAYDHYTPAVISTITARSEYSTAYTPYQPEISQGTLQYIFEYQSMMSQLTGMEVSNASLYDGATATAEAMLMAVNASRRKNRVLISETVNPATMAVVNTYARYHGVQLDVIPAANGVTDKNAMDSMLEAADVAGVIVQSPNYYGIIEDFTGWADQIHAVKAHFIINSAAINLASIKTPGEWGADIAVGDAQSLGMPLNYGGPYLGYMCATKALIRKMPGRIVGATTDEKGQRVFVLTLQAREQHIRREKATSNICSNQGIMTLHAAIYMSLMGTAGLQDVNNLSARAARKLAHGLEATGKMHLTYPNRPYLNEFTMTVDESLSSQKVLDTLAANGILGGVALGNRQIIIAATEKRTDVDIEKYVEIINNL